MSVYFLRRKGWSLETIEGISNQMQNEAAIYHSKETLPKADTIIRWGCTQSFPGDAKVINQAQAIHKVYDKGGFRAVLQKQGLCPETTNFTAMDKLENISYPCVVRPKQHCQAEDFYICENIGQVLKAVTKCGEGFYISHFITKAKEYRVFIASGRVVTVMEKLPKVTGQEVWNDVEEYVSFYDWPLSVVKAAVEAHVLSELDFSAVDVIVDKDQKPYVLELNTAPEIQSPYRQKCMAKVFDWMIEKGKEHIPLPKDNLGNWRKFTHPAISSAAVLT